MSPLLSLGIRGALGGPEFIARTAGTGELPDRRREHVVGDGLQGDVISVVDEADARDVPPAPDLGG
jgi:hypothetical protein